MSASGNAHCCRHHCNQNKYLHRSVYFLNMLSRFQTVTSVCTCYGNNAPQQGTIVKQDISKIMIPHFP